MTTFYAAPSLTGVTCSTTAAVTSGALLREVARLHVQLQRGTAASGGAGASQCALLCELGRRGPMTLVELGRRLSSDKGWVSRAVDALARAGLLAKTRLSADRRAVLVSLTPAGEERFRRLNDLLDAQAERIMARVPENERGTIARALEALREALRREAAEGCG